MKDLEKKLEDHFKEDVKNFKKIDVFMEQHTKDHEEVKETMLEIKGFMSSLSWLSDISRGTELLKRPSLWFIAFVVGLVALLGGVKSLSVLFMSWIFPK